MASFPLDPYTTASLTCWKKAGSRRLKIGHRLRAIIIYYIYSVYQRLLKLATNQNHCGFHWSHRYARKSCVCILSRLIEFLFSLAFEYIQYGYSCCAIEKRSCHWSSIPSCYGVCEHKPTFCCEFTLAINERLQFVPRPHNVSVRCAWGLRMCMCKRSIAGACAIDDWARGYVRM